MRKDSLSFRLGLLAALLAAGCEGAPPERVPPRHAQNATLPPEVVTLRGEVVALGCYLRQGARGPEHRPCAAACLKRGMPAGLLTDTGELLLLLPEPDAALDLPSFAAEACEVEGTVVRRNGMRGLLVRRLSSPPPAPAPSPP